jgi:hypothetical protein
MDVEGKTVRESPEGDTNWRCRNRVEMEIILKTMLMMNSGNNKEKDLSYEWKLKNSGFCGLRTE